MRFVFLGKLGDRGTEAALEFLRRHPSVDVAAICGRREDAFPQPAGGWEADYLVSYLAPWVVPEAILKTARGAALNFHPGPPEYPGIGCTNFAIYDGVSQFGVTCHHMARVPDTGAIVGVKRFPLFESDSVLDLTQRAYQFLLELFLEVMPPLLQGQAPPLSPEIWRRKPYLRRELDALCDIRPGMSEAEVRRRVRAATFPGMPGARLA